MTPNKGHDANGLLQAAQAFAREEGIDLEEVYHVNCADMNTVLHFRQRGQESMPPVPMVYRPSGTMPREALTRMIGTSIISVPVGILMGVFACALLALLAWLLLYLAATFPSVWFLFDIPCYGVVFLALVLPFAVPGFFASARIVAEGAKKKNRNVSAPVVLSVAAGLAGGVMAWLLFEFLALQHVASWLDWSSRTVEIVGAIAAVIGTLIGAIGGGIQARADVRAAKFCEDCNAFMERVALKHLQIGPLKSLVRALAKRNLLAAAGLFEVPKTNVDGDNFDNVDVGIPELFFCPGCGKGYLEVTARYRANIVKSSDPVNPQNADHSWLVVSVALAADEVAILRPYSESPQGK